MKELLEQLGFKDERGTYLPMLSEFVNAKLKHTEHFITTELGGDIVDYTSFITRPLKEEMFSGGRDYYETIEQAINQGIKLYLK